MSDYRIRLATPDDHDALVHHRLAMFEDMGIVFDPAVLDGAFRPWLHRHMEAGDYRAWVVETGDGTIVAGGGLTIIPWPPGPRYLGDRLAFVYNVYTEPDHRRRGLSRRVMQTIHEWCRDEGISTLALNASRFGQPLYESLGYAVTPSPMMFLALD
jgi:GNAT superfamily N-acetyltransferase